MLKALAIVFAVIAVALLSAAIVGMTARNFSPRTGWLLRAAALGCFALTVILNTLAH